MAVLENGVGLGVLAVAGAGVGALLAVPFVIRASRPMIKGAVKTGMSLYRRGSEAFQDMGEMTGDIFAEARAELARERRRLAEEEEEEHYGPRRRGRMPPRRASMRRGRFAEEY